MLYYVLEDAPQGLVAAETVDMDEAQTRAFKTRFWVDQSIDDDEDDGRRRPKDIPNP